MAQGDVRWLAVFVINSVETPMFAVAMYNISSSNNKHNKRTYFVKQSTFDKKLVAQLIIRISILYGARNFISLLTSLRHLVLSWVTSAAQLVAVFKISTSINAAPLCTCGGVVKVLRC
jgi:magnesium-transporting ATPase (P-type)